MPKMIGNNILEAIRIEDNECQRYPDRINLTYAQAALMPPAQILKSMDTSDTGSKGTYAKRWYRWFASASDILACPDVTDNMRRRAATPGMPSPQQCLTGR